MLINIKKNILTISAALCLISNAAFAFVGVYITKDGSNVISSQSKVVIAHKDQKTILTVTSNFDTSATNFALVIPVPSTVKTANIRYVDYETLNKLDNYTSPRLIEYIDYDPCNPESLKRPPIVTTQSFTTIDMDKAIALETDSPQIISPSNVIILTSKESTGIDITLKKYGYNVPQNYLDVLKEYHEKQMKFIIIEVIKDNNNLATWLQPIQIEYESNQLSLPVNIGSLNAPENQKHDMLLFTLSNQGEMLTTNYETKNMPGNLDLPVTSINEFTKFYDEFMNKIFKVHPNIIRKEYSWPMGACKPCTSAPLSIDELSTLGTFWYHLPKEGRMGLVAPFSAIYVTRLHTQYAYNTFKNDLTLEEDNERKKYQTYFNIKHPIPADQSKCGNKYTIELKKAQEQQNKNLQLSP